MVPWSRPKRYEVVALKCHLNGGCCIAVTHPFVICCAFVIFNAFYKTFTKNYQKEEKKFRRQFVTHNFEIVHNRLEYRRDIAILKRYGHSRVFQI